MEMGMFVIVFIGIAVLIIFWNMFRRNPVADLVGNMLQEAARQEAENDRAPIKAVSATVVTRRTNVSGMSNGMTSTHYYCTFEVEGGQRAEFLVTGADFGRLVEGDRGMLTYQGTRFKNFARRVS